MLPPHRAKKKIVASEFYAVNTKIASAFAVIFQFQDGGGFFFEKLTFLNAFV